MRKLRGKVNGADDDESEGDKVAMAASCDW